MTKNEVQKVNIRGFNFQAGKGTPATELNTLYFIFKALDGDELAAEILNSYGKVYKDIDGKQIWPRVEESV